MIDTSRHCLKLLMMRHCSTMPNVNKFTSSIELLGQKYPTDSWTNVPPKIVAKLGENLHTRPYHPLSHVRQRIVNYFYTAYRKRCGNPMFSVFDNLNPIVSVNQNFDSLLVANDHPSRNKSDCYYINERTLLRAHTTAHQSELVSMGLNNFLVIGDVYRRDEINATHHPVFHQVDAVRIRTREEVFQNFQNAGQLKLFQHDDTDSPDKQCCHTVDAVKIMEHELKTVLVGLAQELFGIGIKTRWVEQYFPFTHPSWELEVYFNNDWLEVLGCGIMRQGILEKCGAGNQIGWAFGLGLERLAMCLYNIPDIRLFWSKDPGFLHQFKVDDPKTPITYKVACFAPVSVYPPCTNDLSFWLPDNSYYSSNDFYDIVREIAGDCVEHIDLIDQFTHPQSKRTSHCYRIVYRHMEKTLRQREVNILHKRIADAVVGKFKVNIR